MFNLSSPEQKVAGSNPAGCISRNFSAVMELVLWMALSCTGNACIEFFDHGTRNPAC